MQSFQLDLLAYLSKYNIEICKIEKGISNKLFTIDNTFFNQFEFLSKLNGRGTVDALIDKQEKSILVMLSYKIILLVECDRCLELMNYTLNTASKTIYTFDDYTSEMNGLNSDVLPANTKIINISSKIYEDISIGLPARFIHAENGNDSCNPNMLNLLEKYSSSRKRNDPRWDILKKSFSKHKK